MQAYSVLMSVYQKEAPEALTVSLDSMICQTLPPQQIVLVKDGPLTDALEQVIDRYCSAHDGLFTLVAYPENRGLAYALNAGLKACRNELVARMDSDDYSLPSRCEMQVAAFEADEELVVVGANMQYFDETIDCVADDVRVYPAEDAQIRQALRRYSPFAHPAVMYKKSHVLACGGYDEALRRRQDMDLFSRMIVHEKKKAMNLQQPLLYFRRDASYYTRNKSKESCNNRIAVQRNIYRRGDCSLTDYLYVWAVMTVSKLTPRWLYGAIYTRLKNRRGK